MNKIIIFIMNKILNDIIYGALSSNFNVVHYNVVIKSERSGYSGKSDAAINYIEYVLLGSKFDILKLYYLSIC